MMSRLNRRCAAALVLFLGAIHSPAATNSSAGAGSKVESFYTGSWIWADRTTDKQTCRFWKSVDIPSVPVARARLWMTADNSYRAFLDGREFGQGSELRSLTQYDLSLVLTPGTHVLAVEAFNEYAEAGVLAGLRIELQDGQMIEIPSDATWRVVTEPKRGWSKRKSARADWPAATVIAPYLGRPWVQRPFRILLSAPLQPVVVQFWQAGWFQIVLLGLFASVAVLCLRLLGQLAFQSQAQQVLQRERARIARDIHDEMGAGLTQLVLLGEVAQSELPGESEAKIKFDRMSESGRRLLRAIDEIVWMVNSQRDTLRDFETYVCTYAEDFLRPTPIRCRLDVDAEVPQAGFDLVIRRNLFLAIKEALNNVVKHSGASEMILRMRVADGRVTVSVADNGKGFTTDRVAGGNGLCNMAQRAAEVGGTCAIVRTPEGGCCVELTAPLAQKPRQFGGWWTRLCGRAPSRLEPRNDYHHGT